MTIDDDVAVRLADHRLLHHHYLGLLVVGIDIGWDTLGGRWCTNWLDCHGGAPTTALVCLLLRWLCLLLQQPLLLLLLMQKMQMLGSATLSPLTVRHKRRFDPLRLVSIVPSRAIWFAFFFLSQLGMESRNYGSPVFCVLLCPSKGAPFTHLAMISLFAANFRFFSPARPTFIVSDNDFKTHKLLYLVFNKLNKISRFSSVLFCACMHVCVAMICCHAFQHC